MADFSETKKAKEYIDIRFDKIEAKLKNSFQAIKQDINSIKESIEKKSILAKAKPLQQTSELESEVITLRKEIHHALSSLQAQLNEQSKTKSLEMASARALAEQINNLKDTLVTKPEIEKIDTKFSYELAKLKSEVERKITEIQKQEIDIERINQKPMQRIKEIELWLPNTMQSYKEESKREKEEILKEVKKEISALKETLEEKDKQISIFNRQLAYFRNRLNKIKTETPEETDEYEEAKKPSSGRKIRIPFKIILQVIIAIALIFALSSLILFTEPSSLFGLFRLDAAIAPPSTGLHIPFYYNTQNFAFLSGWESKLTYNNKEDRIMGYNISGKQVGWFYQDANFSIEKTSSWAQKALSVDLFNPSSSTITNTSFNIAFFRGKPYSKISFNTEAGSPEKLSYLSYGLTAEGYNLLLPDGTEVKNDFNSTEVHGLNLKSGSSFNLTSSNFEIFINPLTNFSFVLYSQDKIDFANSFADNLFIAKIKKTQNNTHSPVYIAVFPNAQWVFYENYWLVNSKTYIGKLNDFLLNNL
jgi:hypothetical protein